MSIERAASLIRRSSYLVAFTGAGISVESGIPAFRGDEGLWNRYDPRTLEIGYFLAHPLESWKVIREIFYDHFGRAEPNDAHRALAVLEREG
ncbi:MAG: RNA polymerase subunit sigma, partial [Ignavibacteria bacterium]